ncbi:MAG: tetratricopeptide repeat protein [Rhodothermales bacterium]|nr:tetratricopeptide repeat protein [Rhodothermales bacterium]
MKESTIILSLLSVLLIVAAVSFIRSAPDSKGSDELTAQQSANPSEPSRDNIGHTYIVEEQRLKAAVAADPQDSVAVRLLANFYHDAHKQGEAVPLYERYLELNPVGRQQMMDLASCYGALEDLESALEVTKRVLANWPHDSQAMYNMGALYANQGDRETAATWWHTTLEQAADTSIQSLARQSLARLANM